MSTSSLLIYVCILRLPGKFHTKQTRLVQLLLTTGKNNHITRKKQHITMEQKELYTGSLGKQGTVERRNNVCRCSKRPSLKKLTRGRLKNCFAGRHSTKRKPSMAGERMGKAGHTDVFLPYSQMQTYNGIELRLNFMIR